MIGIIGGIFGGISGSLLIFILDYAQKTRELSPKWIWILPLVGAIIPLLKSEVKLILGSFLTHLGGGSAGREGAVVHLSRSLSERIASTLRYNERTTKDLVMVSMGAAFGTALGAPIAGLIFGLEFNKSKLFRPRILLHGALAALISQNFARLTQIQHFRLPAFSIEQYEIKTAVIVLITGILFGLASVLFHFLRKRLEFTLLKIPPVVTGLAGGLILTALFHFFKLEIYQGLGRETILQASQEVVPIGMVLRKIILSVITLGTGFQGGEFFPLAFIGSTIGSAFSFIDPSMTALLVALGFVTTYGAATQTPIACTLLAYELFGWKILPYAMITLWIANKVRTRFD